MHNFVAQLIYFVPAALADGSCWPTVLGVLQSCSFRHAETRVLAQQLCCLVGSADQLVCSWLGIWLQVMRVLVWIVSPVL
ncbi:hypothetical protein COO60DRAFT_1511686, partial [Scenedesmus sp. NREL 46B-D3]